jgi:hypothetical protein
LLPQCLLLTQSGHWSAPSAAILARKHDSWMLRIALNQQQDYPERTGIFVQKERYCVQFGALAALRDPAPPASSLRWGFGGGGDGRRATEGDSDDQVKVQMQARITRKRPQDQDP